MGCICSCLFPPQNDEPKPTTPLLQKASSTPGPQPSNPQAPSPQSSAAPNGPAQSARRLKRQEKERTFVASVEELAEIELAPTTLPTLDKSLMDHARLHNTVLANHRSLRSVIHEFKELFLADTAGIPVMVDCIQAMKDKCGNAQLSVGRKSKYCIQIEYDAQEVSKESGPRPEVVISALELFNKANKLTKDIMDRAPNVNRSVQLILNDESSLRKEVTKADLDPSVGPEAMKNCVENISKMRKIPSAMETIQRDTKRVFDEILEGSKCLFENTEPKPVT